MITEELKKYIRESFVSGKTTWEIKKALIDGGWQNTYIDEAFIELGIVDASSNYNIYTKNKPSSARFFIYSAFSCIVVLLSGTIFYLWQDRIDLTKTNTQEVQKFYTNLAESQISFTNTGDMVFPDEQKFITQKNEYVQNKESFIEANLRTMQLTLYEDGTSTKILKILTKGKEGSWWETPTGNYKVLGKSANAYSSIGNVWMPYSIQFYGNYLIHGWPYHDDGTPVPQGYSGGCIRLSTEDAKVVFTFAKVGVPILVLENHSEQNFGILTTKKANAVLPAVKAKSFLISNLSTGEIILEKKADEKLPIASLTKLMTAVVAHEIIYLGRSIKVTPQMLADVSQVFYPTSGERYTGLDLLYPLLMQSSNNSAKVLSGFVGDETFVQNMNKKASSLQMTETTFADPAGINAENISTAYDVSKLLQYIYYKRPFIFEIGKGVAFKNVGVIKIGETVDITGLKNFNDFVGNPDLIGSKNGETTAAKQTLATVWNIHTKEGVVPVAIIILGSENRKIDGEILLKWLKNNYSAI